MNSAKNHSAVFIHRFNYRKRFKTDAHISYQLAAILKALFDYDACAAKGGACLVDYLDKSLKGAAVCKEVIDDEHLVIGSEKLFGNYRVVNLALGKGFNAAGVNLSGNIFAGSLFGEYHRNAEFLRDNAGDTDAGGLDGEYLVYLTIGKSAFKLLSKLRKKTDVHLMIQKTIDL